MSFASPALLAALLLGLPVLLAFLVRRRRQIVRVPSTLLYRLAGAPSARRRRFKHVRHLASLLACLGAVAALVLAAARPEGGGRGETVAFVVDVSASMGAGGRSSPLSQAQRFVSRSIAGGGRGDRYAIIAAGAVPVRLAGPIAPGPALDAAVGALHEERGAVDLDAAIELAASLIGHVAGARVIVLGDGGEDAAGLVSVRDVPVTRRLFPPKERDNLGVVAFATRPAPEAAAGEREALITVASSSDRPRAARVTLLADGQEILSRRVDVPPHGDAEVRARVLASVTRLVARVRPDDGAADALATDDEATLSAAARPMPHVLLLAPAGNADEPAPAAFFVEKALRAAGVKEIVRVPPALEGVTPRDGDLLVALNEGPARRVDVPALYLGSRAGALPVGEPRDLGDALTHLRSLETKDPLLRGVSLDGVTIEHAVTAVAPHGARVLVELDGGPVMLAGGAGRTSWVYLGVDPLKSDLVLRVAFPVLVANALSALGGAADVVVADTVARSEVTLRRASIDASADAQEPDPRLRFPLAPAVVLALIGAALLAFEAYAWRKGWAS